MPTDPQHVQHQEVGPRPGDLIVYQGADLGRLCLVICSQRTLGLVRSPGWRVVLLTSRGELCQLLIHDETREQTWSRVNDGSRGE